MQKYGSHFINCSFFLAWFNCSFASVLTTLYYRYHFLRVLIIYIYNRIKSQKDRAIYMYSKLFFSGVYVVLRGFWWMKGRCYYHLGKTWIWDKVKNVHCYHILFDLRNIFGVRLVFFLNTLLKYEVSENPVIYDISVMLSDVLSKRFFASSIRKVVIYSRIPMPLFFLNVWLI